MQSKAATATEYVKGLSGERRRSIQVLRKLIKKNLPSGYKEMMQWGMISYAIPLSIYLKGYGENPDVPLPYLALASQKNYMSLYLMNIYGSKKADKWFREAFQKAGKKLDMGKGCVRFKKLGDLPLDVISQSVALTPVKKFIEQYKKARQK